LLIDFREPSDAGGDLDRWRMAEAEAFVAIRVPADHHERVCDWKATMKGNAAVLSLRVRSPDACIDRASALAEPGITTEVSDRLVELAKSASRAQAFVIELVVDASPSSVCDGDPCAVVGAAASAMKRHFRNMADGHTRRIANNFQYARFSSLMGLLCVVFMLGCAQAIPDDAGSVLSSIRESLTIFAWVAMWKPAELWLYAHWPERYWRRLAGRLADARVVVRSEGASLAPDASSPGAAVLSRQAD
jgi:hypothetical protein